MFRWFNPHNFMDTVAEWHSFVIGLGDGVSFQKTQWQDVPEIRGELQYYKFGVLVGRFAIIAFITLLLDILLP